MIIEEKLAEERNEEQNSRPSESQLLSNTDSMNAMICGTSVEDFWDNKMMSNNISFLQSDGIENKIETKEGSTVAVTAQDDNKHKEK